MIDLELSEEAEKMDKIELVLLKSNLCKYFDWVRFLDDNFSKDYLIIRNDGNLVVHIERKQKKFIFDLSDVLHKIAKLPLDLIYGFVYLHDGVLLNADPFKRAIFFDWRGVYCHIKEKKQYFNDFDFTGAKPWGW